MSAATTTKAELSSVARHIARVAARLFAQNGYDATSVREIVEAAGVAKPTLYYYFRSKEGLAQALLTVPLSNLVATLRQAVGTVEDPVRVSRAGHGVPSTHFAGKIPIGHGLSTPSCLVRSARK